MSENPLLSQLRARVPHDAPAPATERAILCLEETVGFPLPCLMREVYLRVADGGWGPPHGVIGADQGHADEMGGHLIDLHAVWHTPGGFEHDDLVLPPGLLPFLHVGYAIHYCVDCSTPEGEVLLVEPQPDASFSECVRWSTPSWEQFLRAWLEGELPERVLPSF